VILSIIKLQNSIRRIIVNQNHCQIILEQESYMDEIYFFFFNVLRADANLISCCCATLQIELCESSTKDSKTLYQDLLLAYLVLHYS